MIQNYLTIKILNLVVTIEKLYELIRREDVCLFIGAGFSLYAGYPNGWQLAEKIYQDATPDFQKHLNKDVTLSKLAQDYVTLSDRKNLENLLFSIFKKKPAATDHHDILSRIPFFRTIITTNYDTLIEDSFTKKAVVIKDAIDLVNMLPFKTRIYKIHGCITRKQSMVITDADYAKLYRTDHTSPLWASVISELSTKHVIFLGYGYEDLNIWNLFERISESTNGHGRQRFFIAPNISDLKQTALNKAGVTYFQMTGDELLNGLVADLKLNLKKDVELRKAPLQTSMDFYEAHGMQVSFDTLPESYRMKEMWKIDGLTNFTTNVTFSGKNAIKKLKNLHEGQNTLQAVFGPEDISAFSHLVEDFTFLQGDDIHQMILALVPNFSEKITILMTEEGIDIQDIQCDLYKKSDIHAVLQLKVFGFELEIIYRLLENGRANFNLELQEPKKFNNVDEALKFYQTMYHIIGGGKFDFFVGEKHHSGHSLKLSHDQIRKNALAFHANKLNIFKTLKQVEKVFKVWFRSFDFSAVEESIPAINQFIELCTKGELASENEDGYVFDTKHFKPKQLVKLKNALEKQAGSLNMTKSSEPYIILGKTLPLGEQQLIIHDAYIAQEEKNSLLIKSKINKVSLRFEKFGLWNMEGAIPIW